MFEQIMIPLDGSELAERALYYVKQVGAAGTSTIHLVRVVEPPAPVRTQGLGAPVNIYGPIIEAARNEATEYLERAHMPLEREGYTVQTQVLDGYAASALIDYARAAGIDLILMTTHGRAGFTRWAMGSVADRVLHGGVAPVLLVPAPAIAGEQTG